MSKTRKKKEAAKTGRLSYKKAGVSIKEGDEFVERLKKINRNIGGFSGIFPLPIDGMKKPVLLASTDGVGTKIVLARKARVIDSIGIDLVAMVVNDLIVTGARPLFFLDYYATGRLKASEADAILRGIAEGCREARIPLLGGETAEMPGVYDPGEFDLAGFGVGLADEDQLIDGSTVAPGDVVIGLPSSGIHSNGYSLVRAIIERENLKLGRQYAGLDEELDDILLRPTRIYVRQIMKLLESVRPAAMAHITGGGIPGNLVRVLPKKCHAKIHTRSWEVPAIFKRLQEWGSVDHDEMFRVFNMGIGYVLVVKRDDLTATMNAFKAMKEPALVIGEIVKGVPGVTIE